MKLFRLYLALYTHWHWWKPVPRKYEVAIGCRCGILAMMHLNHEIAKGACKIQNKRTVEKLIRFIKTGEPTGWVM